MTFVTHSRICIAALFTSVFTACGPTTPESNSEIEASGPRRICNIDDGQRVNLRVLATKNGDKVLTLTNPPLTIGFNENLTLLDRVKKMTLDGEYQVFHEVEYKSLRGWVSGKYLCNLPKAGVSSGSSHKGVVQLSESQVRYYLSQVGIYGRKQNFLVCVSKHESGMKSGLDNRGLNKDGTIDVGLFQINNRYWPKDTASRGVCDSFQTLKFDPLSNASCAKTVINSAPHYARHWATYGFCAHLL